MTTKEMSAKARAGLSVLRKAVKEELTRKAKLGQYAIVSRNGKTARVKAELLLNGSKRKSRKKNANSLHAPPDSIPQ